MNPTSLRERLRRFRQEQRWTQAEMAEHLGIKRSRYANFESGYSQPDEKILTKLQRLGFESPEVGPPLIPASQLLVPIPSIGYVAASDPVDWTDPFDSDTFTFVPPEMGDQRGRFACRISSDSMMPLLEPEDTCVFHQTNVPRIGAVILFRSQDHRITVKRLGHDGTNYILRPLNPRYQPAVADGDMVGYLVGIVRERGTQRITIYDEAGIRP